MILSSQTEMMRTKALHIIPPTGFHPVPERVGVAMSEGLPARRAITATRKRDQHQKRGNRDAPGNTQLSRGGMIVRVLASIHGEWYLHGDIRSENILVEHRHDGARVMFIDFGFLRKYSRQEEAECEMAALRKKIGLRSPKRPRTYN